MAAALPSAQQPGWSDADTAAQRAELPALEPSHLLHFNSAGCALPTQHTLAVMGFYLHSEGVRGGYETFDASAPALQLPYDALAALLNCSPQEVAVVTSATAAWQQVVYGLAWTWKAGDRVLASVTEYGSNFIGLLQCAARVGVTIEVIPETPEGDVDLEALQALLRSTAGRPPPVLVCVTHVPTSSGRVYDAAGVGALCRAAGVLFMLDATQSVGQMPIDVQRIGCDFLCGTGRKYLRGSRGSGFLFCRSDTMDKFQPAVLDIVGASWAERNGIVLQSTALRFESYEMSFVAKVGLGAAVEGCLRVGMERTWDRIQQLAQRLRRGLAALPGVEVRDHGRVLCGIVTFTKAGLTCQQVQDALKARDINVTVSRTNWTRLDFEQRQLHEVVRSSVHVYNTEAEVERFLAEVAALQPAAATA